MSDLNPELLEILACPACKSKVKLEQGNIVCTNKVCGLKFPVRDGIPVMLVDEAERQSA